MARIAFLGLGAMGARMAANLLKGGHDVTVWNRTRERAEPLAEAGAKTAVNPREAAARAEIVMAMVRDDAASETVWCDDADGALGAMTEGAVAIESSTVTIGWTEELARRASERGVVFADAPVSGSRPQAEAAKLVYLVGSDPETFRRIEPVLKSMGETIHHCGPVGTGAAMKLAINMLLGVQGAAMAEALGLLAKTGISAEDAVEIISSTPVASPAAKIAAALMAKGEYEPLFPVDLMEKDFANIAAAAWALQFEAPISEAVRGVYRKAVDAGFGEKNYPSVFELYKRDTSTSS
ncbi:MAG: NAD(P)-dependent oxidoreductase [Pararhizobium sp.]